MDSHVKIIDMDLDDLYISRDQVSAQLETECKTLEEVRTRVDKLRESFHIFENLIRQLTRLRELERSNDPPPA